jgi:hypothetical protein
MNHRLVVLDRAQKEIREIQKRYKTIDQELATVFYSQLNLAITKIDQNPLLYAENDFAFRQAPLKQFPYILIYDFFEREITVYSVFHTSQHPKTKPLSKVN